MPFSTDCTRKHAVNELNSKAIYFISKDTTTANIHSSIVLGPLSYTIIRIA